MSPRWRMHALDMETGTIRWASDLGIDITSAPIVAGQTILVGTVDGRVVALGIHSGKQLWVFKTSGKITGSPVVVGNTMYETELGKEVKAILAAGNLVPDSTTIAMVEERLGREDVQAGALLDGYDRTSSKTSRDYPRKKQRERIATPQITHTPEQQINAAKEVKTMQTKFRSAA